MQQTLLNFKKTPTIVEKAQLQINDKTEKPDLLSMEIEEVPKLDSKNNLKDSTNDLKEYLQFVKNKHKDYSWLYAANLPGGPGSYCHLCHQFVNSCGFKLNKLQEKFITLPSINLKASALSDHEKTFIHKEAWKSQNVHQVDKESQGNQLLHQMELNSKSKIPDLDMISHFSSVYFLSKEDIALVKFPALMNLIGKLDRDDHINPNYLNHKAAREILTSISAKIRQDLLKEISLSPYVGIMLDESTDVSSIQYLVINIRYLHNNEIKDNFCSLQEVKKTDAITIFVALLDFLKTTQILSKVTSISTDGASVMIGKENGVAAKLQSYIPYNKLIINHCLSHRLNLGAKDLWNNDKSLNGFNSTIHTICRYFTKSSKKLKILEEEEEVLLESHLRILKPIDIRWLSLYKAIGRILEMYPAIVSTLEIIAENEGCIVAEGLLGRLKSLHFVCLLHIFQDISSFLEPLNLLFQKADLILADAFREINVTLNNLEDLCNSETYGPYFQHFLDLNEGNDFPTFQEVPLTEIYGAKIENMKTKAKQLQKQLLSHLHERFPDQPILQLFRIFDLRTIASNTNIAERQKFGNECMNKLLQRYDINLQQGATEWDKFKTLVVNTYQEDGDRIWYHALQSPLYGSLQKIFQIYLTIPLSTASCERTFSKMNHIKNERRNRMDPDTLHDHMMISLNGDEVENLNEEKLKSFIKLWREVKPRKFFVCRKSNDTTQI